MGTAVKKGDVDVDGGGEGGDGEGVAGVVILKEEEALYLVERGALELRYKGKREEGGEGGAGMGVVAEAEEDEDDEEKEEDEKGIGELGEKVGKGREEEMGVPMSVQAAYTFLIGAGHGLTLERFIVYAGLKRSGYIVLRAPGWDGEEERGGSGAGGEKKKKMKDETSGDGAQRQPQPLGWFSRIYKALWDSSALGGQQRHGHRPGVGPLVGLGVYRSYSQYHLISKKTNLLHKFFVFGS